jgi:hypothetical protein
VIISLHTETPLLNSLTSIIPESKYLSETEGNGLNITKILFFKPRTTILCTVGRRTRGAVPRTCQLQTTQRIDRFSPESYDQQLSLTGRKDLNWHGQGPPRLHINLGVNV